MTDVLARTRLRISPGRRVRSIAAPFLQAVIAGRPAVDLRRLEGGINRLRRSCIGPGRAALVAPLAAIGPRP
jgi:hypothetical protein